MDDWIESTISVMDAVRFQLERIRWNLYYWDIDDDKSGRFEPGVYEDMKDRCENVMGSLENLLADLDDI